MKAIAFTRPLPIEAEDSLVELDLPQPEIGARDLLVNVRAVSVNPVDTKIRGARHQGSTSDNTGKPRVLGWDAAGVVVSKGAGVSGFNVGDEVYYAGELDRPGSNAEYQAVDERLVGRKPKSIGFAEAAALPLTSITAWELLFDRLGIREGESGESLLVSGAAGGVGSILVQLARRLTGLTIIATASRPETVQWVTHMGAHQVIDHTEPLAEQVKKLSAPPVKYIASLTGTARNFAQLVEVLAPEGKLGLIDDPQTLDVVPLKRKAASLHWEFMFARSMWQTADMGEQGRLLSRVADLVDRGELRSTQTQTFSPINVENLKKAHTLAESGKAIGKITLSGF
ncbi:zinc-binding alcohol dehydrogenase family protein [Silvibacterium bohemicum]|uniref:Zinc-type alcohol dehydrogenase-like protein n=1 Tax=Silvibacterium bohemicum TaxID=1577686 RepID=A0A841K4C5_9BACT|nr:zinc-binding alcohol dehydrogenase family protein [Silvibacterium bohemicum]MBB6147417.1 zinc-binding alcohol dehydrogenase family protein [Silvibacterium bohemicum]